MQLIRDDGSFNPEAAGFTDFEKAQQWLRADSYSYRPAQAAVRADLNVAPIYPVVRRWIRLSQADGFYRHQKQMIEGAIAGQSIIATTPTGSGKSLGFMLPAFHKTLSNPAARVLVFYPLRALGQDQIGKWMKMAKELGLGPDFVRQLDGSVPIGERPNIMRKGRIVLATPDVVHAWLMPSLDTEETQNFLAAAWTKIVDEAQAYDGAFGTNMLYLLRRIDHIQSRLIPDYNPALHRQYIGASGTLPDAVKNFKLLTGVDATHIGSDANGAPMYRQNVFHAPDLGSLLPRLLRQAVDTKRHQTIIFVDSRTKVEELTANIRELLNGKLDGDVGRAVLPWKSGLRQEDYDHMLGLIQSKEARIVVSTSALGAGIDVDFTMGVNIGLPASKAELEQRMGRVGRRSESTFIVAAGAGNHVVGDYTLQRYLEDFPSENPILYPNHTSFQLAAAFCLRDEDAKITKGPKKIQPSKGIRWPHGFGVSHKRTEDPWETFAPHERALIPRKGQKTVPQRFFPLRNIPSEIFALVERFGAGGKRVMGNVTAEGALREYTPGAIIRHNGVRQRVHAWHQTDYGVEIVMSPYKGANTTKTNLVQVVRTSLSKSSIVKGIFRTPEMTNPIDRGFIGFTSMKVSLRVTGFIELVKGEDGTAAKIRPYRYYDDNELAQATRFSAANDVDYGPKRHVEYETFGVALFIPERWFGVDVRKDLGQRIMDAYCAKNHILPSDIGFVYKTGMVFWGNGNKIVDNLLMFYERGGNRIGLLEALPGQLRQILMTIASNLAEAANDAGSKNFHRAKFVTDRIDDMLRFTTGLIQSNPDDLAKTLEEEVEETAPLPEGFVAVLEPDTLAKFARTKVIRETVRILSPALNDHDGGLGYWVQALNRKKFYSRQARWVTVQKTEIGKMVDGKDLTMPEPGSAESAAAESVVNRFVAASRITTEVRRPRLAMEMATGKLYKIQVDPTYKTVGLHPYVISNETARSLTKRHGSVEEVAVSQLG